MSRLPFTDQSVPLLDNGVSEQPPTVRLPSQVNDAENAHFSVVDGMTRRPGSWIVAHVPEGLLPAANNRMHPIVRDRSEHYLVVHNRTSTAATIKVLELSTNLWATVTTTTDAQGYLNSASPDEFRMRTLIDNTLILNTEVPLGYLPGPVYAVAGVWRDYDVMVSHTPADDTYHQTTEDGTEPEGFWHYDVDGTTFATIQFAEITGTDAEATGLWNDSVGTARGFRIRFRIRNTGAIAAATWTAAARTVTKTGAFASWTPSGTQYLNVTGGTGVTAGFAEIESKTNDDTVVITAAATALYFGANNADTTFNGIATQHDVSLDVINAADMYGVAAEIEQTLQDAGAADALVAWTSTGASSGYFTITSPYRSTETTVYPPVSAGLTTDLSAVGEAFDGTAGYTVTAGTGSGSTTLALAERWSRTISSGQTDAELDPTKMPVKLVRDSVGVASTGTPAQFTIDVNDWDIRPSGTSISNPLPKPWLDGLKMRDLRYWRDRLWFCADQWVISTQAANLFNVWIDDVNAIGDADPLKAQLSSTQVTVIDYAVPIRQSLLAFTKTGTIFEISGGDILTQTSLKNKPLKTYNLTATEPVVLDPAVYFTTGLCDAQLRELVYDEVAIPTEAEDVSAHVPNFMGLDVDVPAEIGPYGSDDSTIRRLCEAPGHGMVFILRRDKVHNGEVFSRTVFVYRTRYIEGRKVQSAWTRWVFAGVRGIHDIAVIGDYLYMLVHTGLHSPFQFYIARVNVLEETPCDAIPEPEDEYMPILKTMTADQSVTNGTTGATLTNITDLVLAIEASAEYVYQFEIHATAGLTTTGLQLAATLPAGAIGVLSLSVMKEDAASTTAVFDNSTTAPATGLTVPAANAPGTSGTVRGSLWVLNSTLAGNVQFQMAQATASATALNYKKGSWVLGNKKR